MANYCYNIVVFDGDTNKLEELKKLFLSLMEKEKLEICGQLPEFITANQGYMHDIRWEENALYFETRWSPNISIIQQVAEKFNVEYWHSYHELGCLVYGEARFKNKILTDTFLDGEDFDRFEEIENEDKWKFDGKIYLSEFEILDILLERKKQKTINE